MLIDKVKAKGSGRIPLAEVSGLTLVRAEDGAASLIAVGDRSGTVARAEVADGDATGQWSTHDLGVHLGTAPKHGRAQLEAVAADGAGGVLLVQEWPNRGEYVLVPEARVAAEIALAMPGPNQDDNEPGLADLRQSWLDEDGSHTEGVVLLRDGHLLVIKEKDPSALIEFGPESDRPLGFQADRWLEPGQAWLPDPGDRELTALAAWYPDESLADECPDLSDAEPAATRLALLSDQGSAVALVPGQPPAEDPFDGRFGADLVIRVKKIANKPEGIALLPGGDVLIACDRKSKKKDNLFVVPKPVWEPVV